MPPVPDATAPERRAELAGAAPKGSVSAERARAGRVPPSGRRRRLSSRDVQRVTTGRSRTPCTVARAAADDDRPQCTRRSVGTRGVGAPRGEKRGRPGWRAPGSPCPEITRRARPRRPPLQARDGDGDHATSTSSALTPSGGLATVARLVPDGNSSPSARDVAVTVDLRARCARTKLRAKMVVKAAPLTRKPGCPVTRA